VKLKFPGIFFTWRTYIAVIALVIIYILGFFNYTFYKAGNLIFYILLAAIFIDTLILFMNKNGIEARRETTSKLSNGDENPISLFVQNNFLFPASITIIDELPVQFQVRNFEVKGQLNSGEQKEFKYALKPFLRGEYHFGFINVLTRSPLGLVERKIKCGEKTMLPVIANVKQMRKYEFLTNSHKLMSSSLK